MTPAELNEMAEGQLDVEENEMTKLAWQTANLMNIHLDKGKKVTVKQLLGKEKKQTQQDKQQQFNKLMKMLKIEGP